MSSRAQVCAWIAAVVLLVPAAAGAQDRTDRDVIDLIIREGPQALAIRAQSDVINREQLARLAFPNPALTWSREGAGFAEFLQVEQALPVFGTRAALARAAASAAAAAEAERDARLWALRSEAAAAVATLAAAQTRLDAAHAHARDVERLIEILRTREREGEGSRFDRLRAEQELRDARQLATAAAVQLAESRAIVAALLPRDVTFGRITPSRQAPQPPAAAESLVPRALSSRAELRGLTQSMERAGQEADAARRARRPAPTVFGGVKRADEDSGRTQGGVFGLSLSLPVFDAGNRQAARWTAERSRAEAERAAVERQIRAEVARAAEVLALRQAALDADADTADELLRIAEIAYREGEVGILELLDAVRTAARARLRTIEIQREASLARIALERAVGEALWP